MSNVTLDEIVDLTADAFSIPRDAMRHAPNAKTDAWRLSWDKYARLCAALLVRRHTTKSWRTISLAMGKDIKGRQVIRLRNDVSALELELANYAALRDLIEIAERKIDRVHELRMSETPQCGNLPTKQRLRRGNSCDL